MDLTRWAADSVQSQYDEILSKIRATPIVHIDETSIYVQGALYWIWAFTTSFETYYAIRNELWNMGRDILRQWINRDYVDEKLKKLIGMISNGFEYWFTFIIHPGVEPTNNRAKRALREQVILRKIIGTLRNEKGISIPERITTMLVTWEQQGLNSLHMMKICLVS